jgi:hypothetical protein
MVPLLKSAAKRASRNGQGSATPCVGMVGRWPQRVVMHGRRDE